MAKDRRNGTSHNNYCPIVMLSSVSSSESASALMANSFSVSAEVDSLILKFPEIGWVYFRRI